MYYSFARCFMLHDVPLTGADLLYGRVGKYHTSRMAYVHNLEVMTESSICYWAYSESILTNAKLINRS
jgi:hypothetical protein